MLPLFYTQVENYKLFHGSYQASHFMEYFKGKGSEIQ